ncbi:MAG TPA: site-2 protease family protein [Clostridiales bacterium]|nr:site-2 protease family protein [Clostridiales bacterium]
MFDFSMGWVFQKLALIPAILVALTLHELCHGFVAYRLGDHTAKSQGRLSLNPLKHLDPVGTLCLIFVGFGWAKPVPVNPYALTKKPNTGMAWVAAAGPASNLFLAFLGGIFLLLYVHVVGYAWLSGSAYNAEYYFGLFFFYFIQINVVLMIFNLIPLPPLDGSRIVSAFLSPSLRYRYNVIEQYGIFILLLLCIFPLNRPFISYILTTPVSFLTNLICSLAGITIY